MMIISTHWSQDPNDNHIDENCVDQTYLVNDRYGIVHIFEIIEDAKEFEAKILRSS